MKVTLKAWSGPVYVNTERLLCWISEWNGFNWAICLRFESRDVIVSFEDGHEDDYKAALAALDEAFK